MRRYHRNLAFILIVMLLVGCGGTGNIGKKDYGVPDWVNLSAPCPANGTWQAYNTKRAWTTPPTLSVEKVVIKDWLVEIHPVTWESTGVSTYIYIGYMKVLVTDYIPKPAGFVIYGYIDPNNVTPDSNGNPRYAGKTTTDQQLRLWDYQVPDTLYLNVEFFKDKWSQAVLKP